MVRTSGFHPENTSSILIETTNFKFYIMWVLTRAINQYDQDGDYLVTFFDHNPTLNDLSMFFWNRSIDSPLADSELLFLEHLKKGGGRQNIEYEWYYLTELDSGVRYITR